MRNGWEETRLRDVFRLNYGKGLPSRDRSGSGYPVVGAAGIIGYHDTFIVEGPAIVVGRKGSAGAVVFIDSKCWPIDTTYWVEVDRDKAHFVFVRYLLEHLNLPRFVTTTAIPGLNRETVLDEVVLLPPIEEQSRIADLLGAVDNAYETAKGAAAAAAQVAARLRGRFMDDPAVERVRLADAVQVTMGRQRSPKHRTGAHVVPYLRAANVKDGYLELNDVLEMNFTPAEQEKFRLVRGDILVTEGCGSLSQIGANAVWEEQIDEPVCFQNTLLRLRAVDGKTTSPFVAQWARYAFESGTFSAVSSGTNIFHIGAERAGEILFPEVPLPRQKEITDTLDQAEATARAARTRTDALARLHTALLAGLLSGAHRIPASYDRFLDDESDALALKPLAV